MSKQIPELDIIATPTAGQESLIETVVARHDTYATSRMTLAQIFTLGSISGSIKVALDALSTLISGNTTSINTLSSTKLNIAWGTRTGLTANRAIITDGTGVETYLTGTTTQVIGFDGAGKPTAVTPTVDINGLTEKTSTIGATDMLLMYDVAGGANKKHLAQASVTNEGLVEMCTDAEAQGKTDETRYINSKQLWDNINKYKNLLPYDFRVGSGATDTWFWYDFSASAINSVMFWLQIKGNFTSISSMTMKTHIQLWWTWDIVIRMTTTRYRNGVIISTSWAISQTIALWTTTSNKSLDISLPSALYPTAIQDGDILQILLERVGNSGSDTYTDTTTMIGMNVTLS